MKRNLLCHRPKLSGQWKGSLTPWSARNQLSRSKAFSGAPCSLAQVGFSRAPSLEGNTPSATSGG